ncbi:hypothetical protein [Thiohalocapsa halophila]
MLDDAALAGLHKEVARRLRWMDTGMPEGLADKIQCWEAYARDHGLAVTTPRIPGLPYPAWAEPSGAVERPHVSGKNR